jgi:hypothetical protein
VNAQELQTYLERMDRELSRPAKLCVYGSAACILLGEPQRTSLDVDVAAPYSVADEADLRRAAQAAGLPVNPREDFMGDHIEWIGPLRLCLPLPRPGSDVTLWRGAKLTLVTLAVEDLIASKLIRYDPVDQADIRFLLDQRPTPFARVAEAAERLPDGFRDDPLVRDNLKCLEADMAVWAGSRP